jgi:anti-anti-sigma factor
MDYSVKDLGDRKEVAMKGRFTFADHNAFREMIDGLGKDGKRHCVLDLGGVEFIDSAGLGMLILLKDAASEKTSILSCVALRVRSAKCWIFHVSKTSSPSSKP